MAKQPRVVPAFVPASYDDAIMAAIRALASGTATAGQQQIGLRWIIERAAGTYDQPFRPGRDGQTEFACGRQFVGQQIVKVMKLVSKEGT